MGSSLIAECVNDYNHESLRIAKEKIRGILAEIGRKQSEIKVFQARIDALKAELKLVSVEDPLKTKDFE